MNRSNPTLHDKLSRIGAHSLEHALLIAQREVWTFERLCRELGVAATPLRRRLAREDILVPFLPAPATKARLDELKDHVSRRGDLKTLPAGLENWLRGRRNLVRTKGRAEVDRMLDVIAPGWLDAG